MPAMMRKPSVPTKQKFPKNGKNVELKPSTAEEQTGPIYSMENLDKLHFFILVVLPLIGIQGVIRHFSVIVWQSWALALFMYAFGALGITMGYHRLWSHRSFKACAPVRLVLAIAGSVAVQGSIRWWCRGHRYHHRYTDTNRDPYNSLWGLFFSHVGWMLFTQKRAKDEAVRVTVADLDGDWVVAWQHRNYLAVALFSSLISPALIAWYFWNDFLGGLYAAGIFRLMLLHHSTFCINSLAHAIGEQSFDDKLTPRDSVIVAFLTFGEGYHNFHHEFPNDFRNGVRLYQFDPTKWMIYFVSCLGLVWDLKRFPQNEIEKGRVAMLQKKLDRKKAHLDFGVPVNQLPLMSWESFRQRSRQGEKLTIIFNVVHDVAKFMGEHPGGEKLLRSAVGRDATKDFSGQVYDHSRAAQNLLSQMRLARIESSNIAG